MQAFTRCAVERFLSCFSPTNCKPWSLATPTMTGRSSKRSWFNLNNSCSLYNIYIKETNIECHIVCWVILNSKHFVSTLQSTEYKGEYWTDHPTIRLFWEVFHDLPLEKKKQFLCKCCPPCMTPLKNIRDVVLERWKKHLFNAVKLKQCPFCLQCSSQEVTAYPSWAWKVWSWWSSPLVEGSITYLLPTPASTCWTCPSTRVEKHSVRSFSRRLITIKALILPENTEMPRTQRPDCRWQPHSQMFCFADLNPAVRLELWERRDGQMTLELSWMSRLSR